MAEPTLSPEYENGLLLSEIRDLLERIASEDLPASPPGMHFVDATARAVMANMTLSEFVFGCDAAATITLLIGTRSYLFGCPADTTLRVPFFMKVPSGVDVSVTTDAGNLLTCYLVYEPE